MVLMMTGVCCSWSEGSGAEKKPTLAIMPFLVQKIEDPGRGALCPECGGIYRSGDILPGSQRTLTRLLHQKMDRSGAFLIISPERVEEAITQMGKGTVEQKPVPASIQIGKGLSADFVFMGFVFRFEERVGSSLGVEKPASVGFDLHLLRLRDSKTVWEMKFDETQRPLSDDLLKIGSFFRRGAAWHTADELAGFGMDDVLQRIPGIKDLEER
jgi:hypothetical protein